jgi:nitrate/nitrite transport system permease protein
VLGIAIFLLLWQAGAARVQTTLGQLPGPALVWSEAKGLHREYLMDREKEAAFHARQQERAAKMAAANPGAAAPPVRPYTASPTFYTQIVTSLKTVMSGFLLSALLAIPVGIAIGLSGPLHGAVNPLIQVFKPVPTGLAAAGDAGGGPVYDSPDPRCPNLHHLLVTVALCCVWSTMINTGGWPR